MHKRGVLLSTLFLCVSSGAARAQSEPFLYALENRDSGQIERRGRTNGQGFANLRLQADTRYRLWLLRRADLSMGSVAFRTRGPNVSTFQIPSVPLQGQPRADHDKDGLSDAAEAVVGTSPTSPDTDGDQVSDLAEVQAGSNPTDGLATHTGVLAKVDLPFSAAPRIRVEDDLALVAARGGRRLHVFNVYLGLPPREIARLSLPNFSPRDVARARGRAVVAGGSSGLAVVDLTDPAQARVEREIPFPGWTTVSVAAADTLCFVANTRFAAPSELVVVDLTTGAVLKRVAVPEPGLEALKLAGDHVFALTDSTLRVFSLGPQPVPVATLPLGSQASFSADTLSVGRGLAVVNNTVTGGARYRVYDVSTPGSPSLLAESSLSGVGPTRDVALDGSGDLLLAFGGVALVDLSTLPGALGPRFLVADSERFAAYNGQAYVVTPSSLQVVTYKPADVLGVAPTISLSASFPLVPSPRAEEGQLVRVTANVDDDVQVRSVELYVDGVKRGTLGAIPFDFRFTTPRRAQQASVRVRARVFDTGGNSTFSPELTVALDADTQAPTLVTTVPAGGAQTGQIGQIQALLSEPVDLASLSATTFSLIEAGTDGALGTADDVVHPGTYAGSLSNQSVALSVPGGLAQGLYRATLSGITDTAGNALPTSSWTFTVRFDDFGNDPSTASPLTLGQAQSAAIDPAGDQDWFFLELAGGVYHELSLTPAGAATLQLYAADGATSLGTTTSTLAYTPPQTGPVLVRVTGGAGASYQVVVRAFPDDFGDTPAEATPLTLAETRSGAIQPPGSERDAFSVELLAGRDYVFHLGVSGGDGVLRFVDRDGATILSSSTAAPHRLTYRVPAGAGGTYYLLAESLFGATPSYMVLWQELQDDHGDAPGAATALTQDAAATGALEPAGDEDYFRAALQAGVSYAFVLEGSAPGLRELTLFDSDGATVLGFDLSAVTYTSPSAKTVYLRVTGSGAYQVTYREAAGDDHGDEPATGTQLTVGAAPVAGTIESIEDQDFGDWFKVDLVAGTTYELHVRSTSFEEFDLIAFDSADLDAAIDVADTTTGGQLFSRARFTPTASGTYYLNVVPYADEPPPSTYEVRVQLEQDAGDTFQTATPIALGELATNLLADAADVDLYAVDLQAGVNYHFGASGLRGLSLLIDVYDSSGTLVDDAFGRGVLTAPATGTYYLDVHRPGGGGSDDTYWVFIDQDDVPPVPLTLGQATSKSLSTGVDAFLIDDDDFTVDLVAGRTYRVEVTGGLGVEFELRTPDSSSLVTDESGDTFVAAESGTYQLRVTSQPVWRYPVGDYSVLVEEE